MIKAVFFDLDGTLLPMDMERFIRGYFGRLSEKIAKHGYDRRAFIGAVWAASDAMVKNDGSRLNEEAFWDAFSSILGEGIKAHIPEFDAFYRDEFDAVKDDVGFNPDARRVIDRVHTLGLRCVLATNPLFPSTATEHRIKWAGLEMSDFELFTSYENSGFCKPNPDYYRDLLRRLDLTPEECLMVGNDVEEDMIARDLGMKVFLVTDCLINRGGANVSTYPHGNLADLISYLDKIVGE